jgi:flagellar M-ring protein FliF
VTRRTENISYQSSHSVRHVRLPQGTVKRMSVSLLVDQEVRWEGSGDKAKRVVTPPSAEKLKSIHDLVAGVIGFSAERGDQLVVECLPFEATLNPEPLPPAAKPAAPVQQYPLWLDALLKNKIVLPVVGGVVLLALLFGVFRMMRGGKRYAEVEMAGQLEAGEAPSISLNKQIENQLAEQQAVRQKQEADALNALKVPPMTKKTEVLTKHIGEQAKKDSTAMAHVLRSWMSDGKS